MRFKAKVSQDNLNILSGVIGLFEKNGKMAIVFLTEDCFRITVVNDNPDSPKLFSEIRQEAVFMEYRIESQTDNKILFEISISNLSRAFFSGRNAALCNMKLVRREATPCLCFETRALEALVVDVTHDIPVRVLSPNDIYYYMPPEIPPPTVALELPHGRLFKTIVEKMAKISKYLHLDANMAGRLVLRVEAVSVTVKTFFNGLQPCYEAVVSGVTDSQAGPSQIEAVESNKCSVKVDIKKLSSVLHFQNNLIWKKASVFLTSNETLVIHINLEPEDAGSVTCFVPVLIDAELDDHGIS